MPTTVQLRTRLLKKLKELFQLDQPDLDFGFYKIMHAKAEQVERFIDDDLLRIVEEAFADSVADKAESEVDAAKRKLIEAMGEDVFDADGVISEDAAKYPAGKTYTEALQKAGGQVSSLTEEGQVYDHLFRFFERYYDNGDFVSRRYYTRETDDRAAPFAVPYNGEEVKLHWANADQYYIKTAEYFNNFTFDLSQAAEFRGMNALERTAAGVPDEAVKVHFKIVDASEGEHGNVKTKDDDKRFFIIHDDEPITFDENGELVVHFEYRADPEKGSKQEGSWRDFRNTEAVEVIFKALQAIKEDNPTAAACLQLFQAPAPTEKNKSRPLLAKYLSQYTARNTMDYFIHKNLGGFLRRELDFYIKNEVMRLDDLDQADAPAVESYLAKLKVLRKIAHKLIDFLAQLEDFQKKLWLKKKFVVETNYCITLDRVPEALYEVIAANEAQREEWVKLFAIDAIEATEGDLAEPAQPGYSEPLTVGFLKANDKLVLDTRFFDAEFKAQLLSSIEDFDAQCEGLLINSDNFNALKLARDRFKSAVQTIYIDPPYNTDATPIVYKNEFRHSSWMTLIASRIQACRELLKPDGILCIAIDDFEVSNLRCSVDGNPNGLDELGTVVIKNNPAGRTGTVGFAVCHEYTIFFGDPASARIGRLPHSEKQISRYSERDEIGRFEWTNFRKHGGTNTFRNKRPRQYYPIYVNGENIRIPKLQWDNAKRIMNVCEEPNSDEEAIWPIDSEGRDRIWDFVAETARKEIPHLRVRNDSKGNTAIYRKWRLNDNGLLPLTVWEGSKYSAAAYGTNHLSSLFGETHSFSFPKSYKAVEDCLRVGGAANNSDSLVLDFFAGSGTTAEAVIRLNRDDGGQRRFALVEMGDYADTVTKARVLKSYYSVLWKKGKPTSRDTGISHCFKYIRLESYEDTLNNLTFEESTKRTETLSRSPSLKEDYMLRYLLDIETRGSQSLLNIDAFADPTAYQLSVKKPGSDEQETRSVDLIETFNYLLGLRVTHYAAPQSFNARFKREADPELPEDQHTKLVVDGAIQQDADGLWWFRKVEGWVPKNTSIPDHVTRETAHAHNHNMERILIVWRKLTGDLEQDNLMLDIWFRKHGISTQDYEFDTIYVNGSNNLPNLKQNDEHWKVRLIEESFMKRMWEGEQ